MSVVQSAPLTLPAYDGAISIRDWHVLFATQNVDSLRKLQAMTPGRIVMVTIDPQEAKPKISFRTDQNVKALLPPDEADRIAPEKIVIVTFGEGGGTVATRFRIDADTAE